MDIEAFRNLSIDHFEEVQELDCLVKQAITATLQESAAPLANGVFVEAKFGSHRLAWQSIRTSQDRATSLR
jgi:hypothetical protein